uniref:Uncharacterized protein n=1 Tax=Anguilla anguilla TaxID=7936 RepID=A0A0E9XBM0_ANGAN
MQNKGLQMAFVQLYQTTCHQIHYSQLSPLNNG